MRVPLLRDRLAAAGAVFQERHGAEVAARFTDALSESAAVRDAVGLADFSFVHKFRVPAEQGLDFLDVLLAGNVPKIRFGRALHTFMADAEGLLTGDCYVANNDEEFIFLCESIVPDGEFQALLQAAGAEAAGIENLNEGHVLLSLDGFKAWEVARELFGADVLGLPYLSIEAYPFEGATLRLIRAGKTSEFGYLLLAPQSVAGALFDTLLASVTKRGGCACGVEAHDALRLEGRFFNIQAEGKRVRDPLVLGLQWMIDFEKENFTGREALQRRRAAGLRRKIAGVAAEPGNGALVTGARIFHAGEPVGEVVADSYSGVLNRRLGLAVFPAEVAYSGLTFHLSAGDGAPVRTLSLPAIMPKSLTVKLDEL
jgi:glycine cleavage system aminomethyltransferase T